jgi:hypothetical protein
MCFYDEEKLLTYSNSSLSARACAIGSQSKYFLIGSHGNISEGVDPKSYDLQNTSLIFADKSLAESFGVSECFVPKKTRSYKEFSVVVE